MKWIFLGCVYYGVNGKIYYFCKKKKIIKVNNNSSQIFKLKTNAALNWFIKINFDDKWIYF